MKQLIWATFLLLSTSSFSQKSAELNVNNISATINQTLPLFHVDSSGSPGFEVPINSGKHTMYNAGLWIGGKDINGQLSLSVQRYSETDYRGGISSGFQRVWSIYLTTIQYHQLHYADVGYTMPYEIEFWPAHGDITQGEDYYMAPFVDVNSNGVYEPSLGDYPKIKGDQAIWWFMSDDTVHVSGSQPMGIDIHAMAYAYKCSDSAVDNTVFIDYRITNKSTATYYDVWAGNMIDFDIGNYDDDYIGTSVKDGVFYGYNADIFDEGTNGYGVNPPAQGCMIIGPHQDPDGEDNPGPSVMNNYYVPLDTALAHNGIVYNGLGTNYGDAIIDNEKLNLRRSIGISSLQNFPMTDPSNPAQCYNFLRGVWQDGTVMTHDDYGYGFSEPVANFIYPDTTDPQFWSTNGDTVSTWSESTELHTPSDRRMLGSTGPFTITPGFDDSITMVYVYGRDFTSSDPMASVNVMLDRARSIRNYMANCCAPCSNFLGTDDINLQPEILIYPNPFNDIVIISSQTLPDRISVYNSVGQIVLSQSPGTTPKTEINLGHVGPGVYFVVVELEGNIITKKLTKTR